MRGAINLPTLITHPALEPLLMAQSYYRLVNALARARPRSGPSAASEDGHRDSLMRTALANGRVLTDAGWVRDRTVLLRDGRIEALVAADDSRCHQVTTHDLQGQWLLPGFIDVQVNGGGGVLFNDDPSAQTIATIARIAASGPPHCYRP